MAQTLCDMVVERLTHVYGDPRRIGGLYRWSIPRNGNDPLVVAIDFCNSCVKMYLFDAHQKLNRGITNYTIHHAEQIESVIHDVQSRIEHALQGNGQEQHAGQDSDSRQVPPQRSSL